MYYKIKKNHLHKSAWSQISMSEINIFFTFFPGLQKSKCMWGKNCSCALHVNPSLSKQKLSWLRYDVITLNKLLHIQGDRFQKCSLSRPYDWKDKQNPYQLNMLMSILNHLNNSNKLQRPVQETTKLLPRSNQDVSLVEPRKKCQLRKVLIILLLIIGSGLATYVHIYSLSYGWKQINKLKNLLIDIGKIYSGCYNFRGQL